MSTDSTTLFSMEDDGRVSETPIPSQKKCTRGSLCSQSDCLVCNRPISNHHIHNLTGDLEDSNLNSRSNKPNAPADHWISNLIDDFKEAIMDQDIEEMKKLDIYYWKMSKAPDFVLYNRTKLKQISKTAN